MSSVRPGDMFLIARPPRVWWERFIVWLTRGRYRLMEQHVVMEIVDSATITIHGAAHE